MALVRGLALLCLLPPLFLPATAAIARADPYLTWGAKNAPVQQAGDFAPVLVPPSPYGQVGDPYLHVLNWGAKSGNAQPSRPNPPLQVSQPTPRPSPAFHPTQQYGAQSVAPARPQPAAPTAPQPALATRTPPRTPVRTPTQAPVAAPDDGAYRVPASSPYAARIAAARAAQSKAEQAKTEVKATKPASANPAPATQDQAAVTETPADDDKPFVPGEHYTDASEAPRLYSLHRGYGLKPDPITVDSNASGAVLDTSHLDAAQAKAVKDDKSPAVDEDDDTDGAPAKSPDAPSASSTQNASAGKTEKTAQ